MSLEGWVEGCSRWREQHGQRHGGKHFHKSGAHPWRQESLDWGWGPPGFGSRRPGLSGWQWPGARVRREKTPSDCLVGASCWQQGGWAAGLRGLETQGTDCDDVRAPWGRRLRWNESEEDKQYVISLICGIGNKNQTQIVARVGGVRGGGLVGGRGPKGQTSSCRINRPRKLHSDTIDNIAPHIWKWLRQWVLKSSHHEEKGFVTTRASCSLKSWGSFRLTYLYTWNQHNVTC